MKKGLILASCAAVATMAANAQQLRDPSEGYSGSEYVSWPSSSSLDQYVKDWTPGQEITKSYDGRVAKDGWEDEEFFISRVKLRPLISNSATQVYPEYVGQNDKRLLFWVPCGMSLEGKYQTGSLPNGVFDSEVFSAWSYVTHFGNWTSPYGWVPGGFADAAHKHGVMVSGVASIPNATLAGNWLACINGIGGMTDDASIAKFVKFLRYHGVDGLGYNSEFYTSKGVIDNLNTVHGKLVKEMTNLQPGFENPWYGGTTDSGSVNFAECLSGSFYNVFGYSDEPRTIMFTNYNWNTPYYMSTNASGIKATGRDPRDLYLGQNMQGGQASDKGAAAGQEWVTHSTSQYSIGLWGAHQNNLLFPKRTNFGGSEMLKQQGYQKILEQWFTNGRRNPAAKMEISTSTSLSPDDNFQGMSRHMSARSAYGWDLGEEPFITYFSLGNGPRYMMGGEVAYDKGWYNIGMQDYTPTWRFWWADKMLGNNAEDVPANSMNAEYSWDDAWHGGSSLKISGSTSAGQTQYLHLFKTDFAVKANDVVTIRYKVLKGNADVNFVHSFVGSEKVEPSDAARTVVHSTDKHFFYDEWNEVTLKVSPRGGLKAGEWALMGLKFKNAENFEMLLGEMSVVRGTAKKPQMPQIVRGKVLSNVAEGLDAKIVFRMPNNKAAGEPVYNTDVNVSHFNLWAQVQGQEPQFMGATTSWAGLMFKIDDPNHVGKVRLGVQAVSLDHRSSSEISWSTEFYSAPAHEISEEVRIDKSCIKPGEKFRIWFVDNLHPDATLSLYNAAGRKVASNNGNGIELETSLSDVGAYDLVAAEGTPKEKRYSCFAQVSDFSVGRLPEIESLTVNGSEATGSNVEFGMGTELKAGYTGREADGSGSRAIKCDYKLFGGPIKNLNLGSNKSFAVSYWIRISEMHTSGDLNLFGIEDRTGSWPENNWGFFWSGLDGHGHVNGYTKRGNSANPKEYKYSYPETTAVTPGAWTHVTHVFDYNSSNALLMKLYINGVYQVPVTSGLDGNISESNVVDGIPVRAPNRSEMRDGMWIHILGGRGENSASVDASIDDVVVWDGVPTEADIQKAMTGIEVGGLPANVKCFWDFEAAPVDGVQESAGGDTYTHNGRYMSKGQIANAPFGVFELMKGEGEGQSRQCHVSSGFDAGCPYVPGLAFQVVTKPSWSTRQATISNAGGSDTKGEATVVYGKEGDKTLTLTLENSWGKDVKDYPVFSISTAIDGIAADEDAGMKAYTVNKTLFLEFADGGNYEVKVYNMSGMLVGSDARSIGAGEVMHITLGQSGVYVVSVVKDGSELRNIKVVNN